jgi:hypothetical protein
LGIVWDRAGKSKPRKTRIRKHPTVRTGVPGDDGSVLIQLTDSYLKEAGATLVVPND